MTQGISLHWRVLSTTKPFAALETCLRGRSRNVGWICANQGGQDGDSGYLSMYSSWIIQVA
jgi:hypothetical protein